MLADQVIRQAHNAAKWRRERHERLLREGFSWDGGEGYHAPEGMSQERVIEILRELAESYSAL